MKTRNFDRNIDLLPRIASVCVFVIAFVHFLIWLLLPDLKEYSSGSMKLNTTLGLISSAVALWHQPERTFHSRIIGICSLFVLLIGGLTLIQYAAGFNLGIDELIVSDFPSSESLLYPGRMSPIAAIGLSLYSLGCLGILVRPGFFKSLLQWACPVLIVITLFTLIGYIYGEETFYKIGPYIRISWQTAFCLMLLSLGLLLSRTLEGPGRFLSSPGMGGMIARRLLPVMILTPIVFGYGWLYVRRLDLISRELAISLFVISEVLIMITTVAFAAYRLNAVEALGLRSSEERRKAQQKLQDVMDNSSLVIWATDKDGNYTLVEGKALEQVGLKPEQLLGKNHFAFQDGNHVTKEFVRRALNGETLTGQSEMNGRFYATSYVPNRNTNGEIIGMSAVSTDITEQKIAENVRRESEDQLRFALEAGEMGTWQVELATGKVTLSEESHKLFGFDEKTLNVNNTIDAVIHPDDKKRASEELQKAIASNSLYRSEYRIIRPIDGKLRWILATGKGTPNSDGVIRIFTGVILDITEQYQARLALEESEASFRTIANAMPQMVWSTLPDGYHDYYNQRWYEYTGVPNGSTDGEGWNGMFHPEDQPKAWKIWEHSLKTGEPYEIEYRLRHHSGEYRWVLGRALPVRGTEGRIIRWMGTCTDIHDQKLVEQELQESVRSRDEFLSVASHELKTPLTSMMLQSQLLMRAQRKDPSGNISPEKARDFVRLTEKQIKRLTRLVDDMLDVSRIRSGKLSLERETMSLIELLAEVIERMGTQFEAAGYRKPEVPHCENTTGHWDRMRLEQVIMNLLTNAIRYGEKRPIEVHCLSLTDSVRLIVKDHGIGIAPEAKEVIFNRFERGVDANEVSGLGLGLFITKQIVVSHGGTIWVESELGKGSTFIVEFPRHLV